MVFVKSLNAIVSNYWSSSSLFPHLQYFNDKRRRSFPKLSIRQFFSTHICYVSVISLFMKCFKDFAVAIIFLLVCSSNVPGAYFFILQFVLHYIFIVFFEYKMCKSIITFWLSLFWQ